MNISPCFEDYPIEIECFLVEPKEELVSVTAFLCIHKKSLRN